MDKGTRWAQAACFLPHFPLCNKENGEAIKNIFKCSSDFPSSTSYL